MRQLFFLVGTVSILSIGLMMQPQTASADFHCMRIAAVMAGPDGNANVQYVELRMTIGGQTNLPGRQLVFQDATGATQATFTFPSTVSGSASGASILVASREFAILTGLAPDFTFSATNTSGTDPNHPVQSPGGRVIFRQNPMSPPTSACHFQDNRGFNVRMVDSVAYGSYPSGLNNDPDNPGFAGFGTPAAALPSSGTQALILTNSSSIIDDAPEYPAQTVPATPNLTPSAVSPRNNAGTTGPNPFPVDGDHDLVPNSSDDCLSSVNAGQENYDGDASGNACDTEDDGDGYDDVTESGNPLCNGANSDAFEDMVVDDGCPGGPGVAGSFSEGGYNLGTNALGRCDPGSSAQPSSDWGADLSAATPSDDKVTLQDIGSFLAPTNHFNTDPFETGFDKRWDLVPGAVAGKFVNLQDMANLIIIAPPMLGGAQAFNGPACTARTHTISMGEYWFGGSGCALDDAGACNTMVINLGDSVQWTNVGAEAHTSTHCPDNNLSTCNTPPSRAFDTPFPPGVPSAGTSPVFAFSTPGTFLYRCQLHPGPASSGLSMRARIVVVD